MYFFCSEGIIGETLSKFSIWSLYITFVLAVARFIRLQCSDLRMRIPYENLPSCDRYVRYMWECSTLFWESFIRKQQWKKIKIQLCILWTTFGFMSLGKNPSLVLPSFFFLNWSCATVLPKLLQSMLMFLFYFFWFGNTKASEMYDLPYVFLYPNPVPLPFFWFGNTGASFFFPLMEC